MDTGLRRLRNSLWLSDRPCWREQWQIALADFNELDSVRPHQAKLRGTAGLGSIEEMNVAIARRASESR